MAGVTEPVDDALVTVRGLKVHYAQGGSWVDSLLRRPADAVRAVDGVDLDVRRGEILGLVGESGSGKTTLGRAIMRLVEATSGSVVFDGVDITAQRASGLGWLRRRGQMIHQDPHASLSPRLRVSRLLTEPYTIHRVPETQRRGPAELLEMVELSSSVASKHPHELSGGQARRVGLARALALTPEFIVADEPTSGLDVSAAAKVLNLMRDLGNRLGLTYVVITHDLGIVDYLADRLAVMYLGKLVEFGRTERLLTAAAHPYTQALLSAVPEPDPRLRPTGREHLLPGEVPSPRRPPPACRFHTRCRFADDRSRAEEPLLQEIEADHFVACHHWQRVREAFGEQTR
jgi:oligopeptide/dipeptide ABC transporter ATP-binding protein